VADHCLRSHGYINLIIAGKDPEWQWLAMDEAIVHCTVGAGIWQWASNDGEPDVVLACAGDVPTLEALAAVTLLRAYVPDIRIRFVNVVDLMVLEPRSEHPHGLSDEDFDELFTVDKPVIFAFHGYPAMIHKLTYRRRNHDRITSSSISLVTSKSCSRMNMLCAGSLASKRRAICAPCSPLPICLARSCVRLARSKRPCVRSLRL
jgi:phosphoketolase